MYKEEDSGSSHQQLFVQINKRGGTAPRAPLGPYVRNGSGGGGLGSHPPPHHPGDCEQNGHNGYLWGAIWADSDG